MAVCHTHIHTHISKPLNSFLNDDKCQTQWLWITKITLNTLLEKHILNKIFRFCWYVSLWISQLPCNIVFFVSRKKCAVIFFHGHFLSNLHLSFIAEGNVIFLLSGWGPCGCSLSQGWGMCREDHCWCWQCVGRSSQHELWCSSILYCDLPYCILHSLSPWRTEGRRGCPHPQCCWFVWCNG